MDPVALIVTALATGAGLTEDDERPDAVETAYARLREAVRQRLAGRPDAELALDRYEADPQAGHVPLAAALARAGAGDEAGLAAAALAVLELAPGARVGRYPLAVSGSQGMQAGDGNSQVNYFIGKYTGQQGAAGPPGGVPAGRLLAEMTDPFVLEVHRPVQVDHSQPGLPALPAYVPREHDGRLAEVVRAAMKGASGVAVLVGGSSTGKTRACWEALGLLRDQAEGWRLWHPIDPSRPEAALRELPSICRRTVVWLNEAQFYLDAPDGGLGEKVAAGLRELLRDPGRGPVLMLATLWPQFWDTLTARPPAGKADPHSQARELLSGHDISVPAAFTADQMTQLTGSEDPRLALAAAAARDGQVVQFLAGAPELLARYCHAPPAAKALIDAAIDARRLGMGITLPRAFLEAAAPGYLSDSEWDGLDDDWLERALVYVAAVCKGIRGPLTRIRPRLSRVSGPDPGPVYRLADYLDHHGRRSRRAFIPPAEFWSAAVGFADPGDLETLAKAAASRSLLRDAARLRKRAAGHGNASAAAALIKTLHLLHPADTEPATWAAAHAALDSPSATATLLNTLRNRGATAQASALLARDPARYATLDNLHGAAELLGALRSAGEADQAEILAARAAAEGPVDNPQATATLLNALRRAGAAAQAEILAARAAAHVCLDRPDVTATLLDTMRKVRTTDQATALASRAAAEGPVDNPPAIATLLNALRRAGATAQAEILAARAAAHVSLDSPHAMATLLDAMRKAGAGDQAAVLLARDPARYAPLDDPHATARLLGALRNAGASAQAEILAARAAAHSPLHNTHATARLLNAMLSAGAGDQVTVLLARDPARHAPLDDPHAATRLLNALQNAGAANQAEILAARAAAHSPLDDAHATASARSTRAAGQDELPKKEMRAKGPPGSSHDQANHQVRYKFGREPDGQAAPAWGWRDLD